MQIKAGLAIEDMAYTYFNEIHDIKPILKPDRVGMEECSLDLIF